MTRFIVRNQNSLTCALLVLLVLLTFDDIVFRNLNQTFAGLNTGVPNNDAQVLLYPFFDHFIDSLRERGSLDPWNPYLWGGTPAIGNPNVPFNVVLFGLFHLSKPAFIVAMNWHLVLEFCLAATGMYLLCRWLGVGWRLGLLAALLSIYSSSAAWLTNTYSIFFHWAVIPWVLLVLLTQERRKPFFTALLLGLILYFQITYGQAQMSIYSGMFYLLSVLWLFREQFDTGRTIRRLVAGYAIGVCLALHSLLPQLEFLLNSADRESLDWGVTAARYQVPFHYLLNLFVPRLFWSRVPWWPTWNDGWSLWESFNVYIGLFFVLVALYGFREFLGGARIHSERPAFVRRMKVFILLLVVLNATVWGGELLVGLSLGRAVPYSRLTHFLLYPLIFASLFEIRQVFSSRRELVKLMAFLSVALLGLVFLSKNFQPFAVDFFRKAAPLSNHSPDYASALALRFLSVHREGLSDAIVGGARLLLQTIILLGLAIVLYRRPQARKVCLGLVMLVSLVDLVGFFRVQRQRGSEPYPFRDSLHPHNPLLAALHDRAPDFEKFRFSTYTGRMEMDTGLAPNLNALSKIPSVNGYMSFLPRRSELEPKVYRGNWGYVYPESVVKLSAIRYILTGPETPSVPYAAKLTAIARHREYVLLEYSGAVPRFYFPQSIQWGTSRESQRIQVESSGFDPVSKSFSEADGESGTHFFAEADCRPVYQSTGGSEAELSIHNPCSRSVYFAFHELKYPWWRFTLDGAKARLIPLNLMHRVLEIPPGSHRLIFSCVPVVWYWGIALSALAALVFGLTAFLLTVPDEKGAPVLTERGAH